MSTGTAARGAALEILRRVRGGQPFDVAHDEAVAGLSDPDRRLAHEIAAGVLRGRTALDGQLRHLVSRDWRRTPSDVKDLLRIGAYQLRCLDRVPPYAAVQATVEVAKQARGVRSANLVNAVLRRVAEGEAQTREPDPAATITQRLADEFSHPPWLVSRWLERFGPERTRALLEHNNRPAPLAIQPVRWSAEAVRTALARERVSFRAAPCGEGYVIAGMRADRLPGYRDGAFVVQDASQARLLEHGQIPDGATVWDACAGPGGKAAVLSRHCRVLASDVRRDRLDRLRESLMRAAPGVRIIAADARRPPLNPASVDVVLVDAPCSGTGSFARHPDARWRLTPQHIKYAAERQGEILDGASAPVRPGGMLVYLTCSLEREENGDQIDLFLERHPAFERDRDDLFLFPPDAGTDGGFGASLRCAR